MANLCFERAGLKACATFALAALTMPVAAQLPVKPPEQLRTEALARRASERLQALQREADRLASEERSLLGDLRKLEIQRQLKAEELNRINGDAAKVGADLVDTTNRMTLLLQAELTSRRRVQSRLAEMYKLGEARYIRLLLSTSDLRRIGEATRTVSALSKIDRDQIQEHQKRLAELGATRVTLEERAKTLASLRAQAQAAHAALDRATKARAELIDDIDRQRDLNAQLTGELQDAQQKLRATIAQMAGGQTVAAASLPMRPFQGALPWPADGVVLLKFGRPRAAASAAAAPPSGIELSLPEGEPVHAVYDGTVAYAEPFSGFGNLVIVDHGDRCYSLYGHMSSVAVKKGDRVDQGSTVGLAGRNPSGNPSLYFELRIDGKPVDPLQWLKRP